MGGRSQWGGGRSQGGVWGKRGQWRREVAHMALLLCCRCGSGTIGHQIHFSRVLYIEYVYIQLSQILPCKIPFLFVARLEMCSSALDTTCAVVPIVVADVIEAVAGPLHASIQMHRLSVPCTLISHASGTDIECKVCAVEA